MSDSNLINPLHTIELALNDASFEWPTAIYYHFSLPGLIFHVCFMANLSYEVSGLILGNFLATTIHSSHHIVLLFHIICLLH